MTEKYFCHDNAFPDDLNVALRPYRELNCNDTVVFITKIVFFMSDNTDFASLLAMFVDNTTTLLFFEELN